MDALSERKVDVFMQGSVVVIVAILVIAIFYSIIKYDSWRRQNMFVRVVILLYRLKDVPVTRDGNWEIVGKKEPIPLEKVPLLVKEMRESFFTHKWVRQ